MKLSIAIPVYNEEDNIPELHRRLLQAIKNDFKKFKYELIFVDDGSNDNSFKTLQNLRKKDKNIKIIQFSRNFGHHIALTAALNNATGDFIVMMDADLQDRPEEIIKLYRRLKEGYEIVYAIRKNKQFGIFKKINSAIFNKSIQFLVNEKIIINSTIFRIMTKDVVTNINNLKENNRYMIGIVGWVGYKSIGQVVLHDKRFKGETKYNLRKQINLASNAIFSFSDYPLRLGIRCGMLVVLVAILLSFFALARKLVYGTALEGWTSILITILFLGGFQIIFLGIIGEYVGRIYTETKKRPLYIIKNKIG